MAAGSPGGTSLPRPSARISEAYRYGVETEALPAAMAYERVPETICPRFG